MARSFVYSILLAIIMQTSAFASTSNPLQVFPSTTNEISPTNYWLDNKKPYPTNAWFINFALANGNKPFSAPVNMFPYLVQISLSGVRLSYSNPIYYSDPNYPGIISAFYYQLDRKSVV